MIIEAVGAIVEEHDLFYSDSKRDRDTGCIGHLRGDFGSDGDEFWHTWWDHQPEMNTLDFKADIDTAMEFLRRDLLKDYRSMERYCRQHETAKMIGASYPDQYGFRLDTNNYRYYIRCSLHVNDYFYVYCYKK